MTTLLTLALLLLGLVALVVVHEAGHALVARAFGVRVLEFAVGFGPILLSHRSGGGTLFTLRLFPLGGFARLPGMEDPDPRTVPPNEPEIDETTFRSKSIGRRALIILAGPAANILLAFGMLTVFFLVTGIPGENGGATHSPARAALAALLACVRFAVVFGDLLGQLTSGDVSITDSLSGPVGIARSGTRAISAGLFWPLLIFLNLNLALFNLLPILPLDGGHLLFLVLEKALGRPVGAHTRQSVANLGVALLLTTALFATVGDFSHLLSAPANRP